MPYCTLRAGVAILFAAVAFVFVTSDMAWGRIDPKEIREATDLLHEGRYEEACAILDSLKTAEPDERYPQVTFLRGQCRFGMRDFAGAARHYRSMLERNPDLGRVRAELARSLLAMGKARDAREQFEIVLDGGVPPNVGENIERQLRKIEERHRWDSAVSFGFMYDSNVSGAPSDPNIDFFGLPFTLDRDSTEKSDTAFFASFSTGRFLEGPFADEWRIDVRGNALRNTSEQEFDTSSMGASLGAHFNGEVQYSFPVGVDFSREDRRSAARVVSFSPSLGVNVGPDLRVGGGFSLRRYSDLRERDEANGLQKSIYGDVQYTVNPANVVGARIEITANDANEYKDNRFVSTKIGASWRTAFSNGVRLSLQPSYSRSNHDKASPIDLGVLRKDDRFAFGAHIQRNFMWAGQVVIPVLSLTWTKNKSNIKRREFDRLQARLQIRVPF